VPALLCNSSTDVFRLPTSSRISPAIFSFEQQTKFRYIQRGIVEQRHQTSADGWCRSARKLFAGSDEGARSRVVEASDILYLARVPRASARDIWQLADFRARHGSL